MNEYETTLLREGDIVFMPVVYREMKDGKLIVNLPNAEFMLIPIEWAHRGPVCRRENLSKKESHENQIL